MYENALSILKRINNMGYKAYIVGGYPRDRVLNIDSMDIDICTNMRPEEIKREFKIIKDNRRYGSMVIEDIYQYEITTFRSDLYLDSRYPLITYVDSLILDLHRRDFIINTLCIDYNGEYVDLMDSLSDIKRGIIRTVGPADIKFKEDPLRIIRAIRFSLDLNFKLDSDIIESIKKNISLLDNISNKRMEKEINKFKDKEKGIHLLNEYLGDLDARKNS